MTARTADDIADTLRLDPADPDDHDCADCENEAADDGRPADFGDIND
jgi:hypothetical protein